MCPVRCVTYVSGRSSNQSTYQASLLALHGFDRGVNALSHSLLCDPAWEFFIDGTRIQWTGMGFRLTWDIDNLEY
jgi:hypothetical protein